VWECVPEGSNCLKNIELKCAGSDFLKAGLFKGLIVCRLNCARMDCAWSDSMRPDCAGLDRTCTIGGGGVPWCLDHTEISKPSRSAPPCLLVFTSMHCLGIPEICYSLLYIAGYARLLPSFPYYDWASGEASGYDLLGPFRYACTQAQHGTMLAQCSLCLNCLI
jgi:hypothetical protein